jgi:hypothetical protein
MTNISTSEQEASVAAKQARHLEASDHNDRSQPIQSARRRARAKNEEMPDPLGLPDHLEIPPVMDQGRNRKDIAMYEMRDDEAEPMLTAAQIRELVTKEDDGGQKSWRAIRRAYAIGDQAPAGLTIDIQSRDVTSRVDTDEPEDYRVPIAVRAPGVCFAEHFASGMVMGVKVDCNWADELFALVETIDEDSDLACSEIVFTFDVSRDASVAAQFPRVKHSSSFVLLEASSRFLRAALCYWIAARRFNESDVKAQLPEVDWDDLCEAMQEMAATMQPSDS